MATTLEQATERLDAALGRLERVVTRRLDAERSRGDLEIELQLMQDDRARLALELESSAARLERVEDARVHVERRVEAAIGAIEHVLGDQAHDYQAHGDQAHGDQIPEDERLGGAADRDAEPES